MAIDSSYDWHAGDAGGQSWLRPWMVVALLLSAGVHAGLYYWFTKVEVPPEELATRESLDTTRRFRVDKVTVEEATPQPESTDAADKAALTEADVQPFVREDPYELQKQLPDVDIRLTPEQEEMPPLPGKGGAKGPADIAAVLGQDSAELTAELDRLTKRMMERAPASEQQLIITTGSADNDLADEEELLKSYNETLAKLSSAGDDVTQGFSDLDDLLTRTGPILDETKPILMPTDLLFGYDEDSLKQSAELSLMKLGLLIQKNPGATFIIEGHTDTTGSADYNLDLSRRRAESVRSWLTESISLGALKVQVMAFGETRPLVHPTGSKEMQALNRRVEIVIRPPKSAG